MVDPSRPTLGQGLAAEDLALRSRICREFLEMPGLVLTETQAVRLFGLAPDRCNEILADLVSTRFLDTDGRRFQRPH